MQALAGYVHGLLADAEADRQLPPGQPQMAGTAATEKQQVTRQLMAMVAEVLGTDVSLDTPLMAVRPCLMLHAEIT